MVANNCSRSDINCDVERDSEGRFSTDLIIQHHDMIVTSADIGLQVPFFVSECFRDFPSFFL